MLEGKDGPDRWADLPSGMEAPCCDHVFAMLCKEEETVALSGLFGTWQLLGCWNAASLLRRVQASVIGLANSPKASDGKGCRLPFAIPTVGVFCNKAQGAPKDATVSAFPATFPNAKSKSHAFIAAL